jgi:hypothetical protein
MTKQGTVLIEAEKVSGQETFLQNRDIVIWARFETRLSRPQASWLAKTAT